MWGMWGEVWGTCGVCKAGGHLCGELCASAPRRAPSARRSAPLCDRVAPPCEPVRKRCRTLCVCSQHRSYFGAKLEARVEAKPRALKKERGKMIYAVSNRRA